MGRTLTSSLRFGVLVTGLLLLGTGCQPGPSATVPIQNHTHTFLALPDDGTLLLGGHYSLRRSSDHGRTWKPVLKEMVVSLAYDPVHPRTVYAGGFGFGVMVSSDGGAHWTRRTSGLPSPSVQIVAVDVNQPSHVYAQVSQTGLFLSTDEARNWSLVSAQALVTLVTTSAQPGLLIGGAANGLLLSRDGGATWKAEARAGRLSVVQIMRGSPDGRQLYALGLAGIVRSLDGGASWSPLPDNLGPLTFIGADPRTLGLVFAGIADQGARSGLYRSVDAGLTWVKTLGAARLERVDASADEANALFASGWGVEVYKSSDGGLNWSKVASFTD
jgi:photosystem II stability/assembly factor-like uncharacterized protein